MKVPSTAQFIRTMKQSDEWETSFYVDDSDTYTVYMAIEDTSDHPDIVRLADKLAKVLKAEKGLVAQECHTCTIQYDVLTHRSFIIKLVPTGGAHV